MLEAEQPISGGSAAGVQEHGHGNAEFLFKQRQHVAGLGKATGLHRLRQALPRLIGQGREQPVETVFQQGLQGADPTDAIKAEIQTGKRGTQCISQIRHLDWILEVQAKVVEGISHHLDRIAAAKRRDLTDLIKDRRDGQAGLNGRSSLLPVCTKAGLID